MLGYSTSLFTLVLSWIITLFFFFKQKTAYEMRISDWSSDVCSSDLPGRGRPGGVRRREQYGRPADRGCGDDNGDPDAHGQRGGHAHGLGEPAGHDVSQQRPWRAEHDLPAKRREHRLDRSAWKPR